LTLSAVEEVSRYPSCWSYPEVHEAILICGLSLLLTFKKKIDNEN
tara:strand:- start:2410 stop:2544 length:135 start_codon:yes stop_codon:yes gene_type:complete